MHCRRRSRDLSLPYPVADTHYQIEGSGERVVAGRAPIADLQAVLGGDAHSFRMDARGGMSPCRGRPLPGGFLPDRGCELRTGRVVSANEGDPLLGTCEPGAHRGHTIPTQGDVATTSIPLRDPAFDQPGGIEDVEMMGEEVAWHTDEISQLCDGEISNLQAIDDLEATFVTQGGVSLRSTCQIHRSDHIESKNLEQTRASLRRQVGALQLVEIGRRGPGIAPPPLLDVVAGIDRRFVQSVESRSERLSLGPDQIDRRQVGAT